MLTGSVPTFGELALARGIKSDTAPIQNLTPSQTPQLLANRSFDNRFQQPTPYRAMYGQQQPFADRSFINNLLQQLFQYSPMYGQQNQPMYGQYLQQPQQPMYGQQQPISYGNWRSPIDSYTPQRPATPQRSSTMQWDIYPQSSAQSFPIRNTMPPLSDSIWGPVSGLGSTLGSNVQTALGNAAQDQPSPGPGLGAPWGYNARPVESRYIKPSQEIIPAPKPSPAPAPVQSNVPARLQAAEPYTQGYLQRMGIGGDWGNA